MVTFAAVALLTLGLAGPMQAAPAAARPCRAVVHHDVIPAWARAGFSDPRPRLPYAPSRRGQLAALIFGYPLVSPRGRSRANKILWVSRPGTNTPTGSLRLRAQRMRGARAVGRPVTRAVVGGPGPSIIDLPAAGCWRLSASWWGGHRDQIDLRYRPSR